MRAVPIVLSLVLASAGALAFAFGGGGGGTDPVDPPPPPVNTAFAGVLVRVGLGADVLAASGIIQGQVSSLVAALEGQYNPATLASLDDAFIQAKQDHDRLRRKVTSGLGTQQDVAALRSAETALGNATSARDSRLAALRDAALATVAADKATLVRRIQTNRAAWSLPVQYSVKDRTEAQWVALRDAVDMKRASERDAEELLAEEHQSLLASVDAESEIAAAKVALDTNLASVQTAWNIAASD